MGGSTIERSTDLVIDSEDNILVTGYVYSNNFPTENAFQIEIQGRCDVFITKITNDGTEKIFSTYLGGEALDQGHAISVDGEDNVIVVGDTMSAEYPCTVDPISNHTGQNEAFITKLSKDGRELIFSTTLGGENEDTAIATINTSNNAQIIVGFTYSPHFPTVAASQAMYGGDCDMFLSKIYLPTRESNENTKTIPGFSPLLIIMIGTISVGIKIRKKHQK